MKFVMAQYMKDHPCLYVGTFNHYTYYQLSSAFLRTLEH